MLQSGEGIWALSEVSGNGSIYIVMAVVLVNFLLTGKYHTGKGVKTTGQFESWFLQGEDKVERGVVSGKVFFVDENWIIIQ